ncbi:rhodanese-like domain-containing protein [bacterium]|nr:rhodanese-like domain-containing protein [bacterium]MCP5461745.1 rhodanese-like domain-containing protein [bacterium]
MKHCLIRLLSGAFVLFCILGQVEAMGKKTEKCCKLVEGKAPVISVSTAHQLWQGKKAVFVDALPADWYSKGHVPGAVNIPASDPESAMKHLEGVAKDAIIISYCAHKECHAGETVADYLISQGYTQVYDFKGGIKAWKDSGLPVE